MSENQSSSASNSITPSENSLLELAANNVKFKHLSLDKKHAQYLMACYHLIDNYNIQSGNGTLNLDLFIANVHCKALKYYFNHCEAFKYFLKVFKVPLYYPGIMEQGELRYNVDKGIFFLKKGAGECTIIVCHLTFICIISKNFRTHTKQNGFGTTLDSRTYKAIWPQKNKTFLF